MTSAIALRTARSFINAASLVVRAFLVVYVGEGVSLALRQRRGVISWRRTPVLCVARRLLLVDVFHGSPPAQRWQIARGGNFGRARRGPRSFPWFSLCIACDTPSITRRNSSTMPLSPLDAFEETDRMASRSRSSASLAPPASLGGRSASSSPFLWRHYLAIELQRMIPTAAGVYRHGEPADRQRRPRWNWLAPPTPRTPARRSSCRMSVSGIRVPLRKSIAPRGFSPPRLLFLSPVCSNVVAAGQRGTVLRRTSARPARMRSPGD